jgi:ABC-2 type transport system ATP-binding protein
MHPIQTRNLTKVYTSGLFKKFEVHALDDVSLEVNKGEIFGLLGPNGAGKTTFIRILLGITYPTTGEAFLLEKPVSHYQVKSRIGYLPENHQFPRHMTGERILTYFGKLSGLDNYTLRNKCEELLNLVNMTKWKGVRIKKYSKGMLQRIGLAQAMINDPDVLFLDEPTDGVDPVGRKEIRDILKRLRDRGKTIFLNSHLLSEVELVSDRVAILKKGKVIRSGATTEFTKSSDEHEVKIDGTISDELLNTLRSYTPTVRLEGNALTFTIADRETINNIIDKLRRENISIESMSRRKGTLEDTFIDLMNEDPTP